MNIKVIATGSSKKERSIRRWGVSFLIGEDVLFDAFGDSDVFQDNIRKFNIDAVKIKRIILSHDDWDHITGLWDLLSERKDITIYICPGFQQEIKDRISSFGVKLVEAEGVTQIKDGIYSTGELCGESQGRKIYEQSVVIRTINGLTIICGCAHPGVVKIVRHVHERFCEDICLLLGGFHLKDNTDELNRCIIADLRELGVRRIAPMHCTGKAATGMMSKEFGRDFIQVGEGESVEV